MAEYIEREVLIEFFKVNGGEITYGETMLGAIISRIKSAPTADVVEVVRCKECKHYEIHRPSVTLNCEREGKLIPMNPTDFCSYGARKEGANND